MHDLAHDTEFIFDDCRNTKPLPFDFSIWDNHNNLKFLIEYDGRQHFEPIEFFWWRGEIPISSKQRLHQNPIL